ncbi:hypothetical protein Dda_8415 [Drechslerella dactyloides]|uniref:F-box domain-containing protein n=1 Tax=Drechslerella dactyloides TaxID=74499 RepID=A0AAD6NFU0_DREDA|nr:hypothetical protein Dda_8415 [Drechslerella dactyloides]
MSKRRRLSDSAPSPRAHPVESRERGTKRRYFGKSPLLDLPQELVLRILDFLPVQSLLTISRTSHKLHTLASDPQLWKSKFRSKFVHPRIQRRARLGLPASFGYQGIPNSISIKDWKLWLDDHILVEEERDLVARPPVPSKQPAADSRRSSVTPPTPLKPPRLDWKGKFRLRSNWERGTARSDHLSLLALAPAPEPTQSDEEAKPQYPSILGCFHQGYFISADSKHGVRVFTCGSPAGDERKEIAQRPISLGNPTCLKIEESLFNDVSGKQLKARGIDFVVGYHNLSFAIYHFDPTSRLLSEKYIHRRFNENERIEFAAFCFPYLVTITSLNQCSIMGFHNSMVETPCGGSDTKREPPPANQPFLPPTWVASLEVDEAWFPTCISFRKDTATDDIIASVVFSIRSIVVGASITVQEFHLAPDTPKLRKSQVASPPLHDALDQAFFGRTAHMAFTTPTCVSYRYPNIITSHADNTLVLYSLHSDEDGKLVIESGHQLWGHNTSVMTVEVGPKKAVSVDRRGEVRVWDLIARKERTFGRDKSIRIVGSGDPLFLNLDGKQGVQTERCSVGFGDEEIVVMEKVKDLDRSTLDFRLVVYDFT